MRFMLKRCAFLFGAALLAVSLSGPSSAQWATPWDVQTPVRQTANLNVINQVMSGGATTVSQCAMGLGPSANAASCTPATNGTVNVNCGLGPTQYLQNNAAFSLSAPTKDGSCLILVQNGASAGAVSFPGFSVGSNTGATLTTTNGNFFTISVWRVTVSGGSSVSGYNIFAHQ